jgi:hypothetical protein
MRPENELDAGMAAELRAVAQATRERADDAEAIAVVLDAAVWRSARQRDDVRRAAREAAGRAVLESERVMVLVLYAWGRSPLWTRLRVAWRLLRGESLW